MAKSIIGTFIKACVSDTKTSSSKSSKHQFTSGTKTGIKKTRRKGY